MSIDEYDSWDFEYIADLIILKVINQEGWDKYLNKWNNVNDKEIKNSLWKFIEKYKCEKSFKRKSAPRIGSVYKHCIENFNYNSYDYEM